MPNKQRLLHVGFDNVVLAERVVAIISSDAKPVLRLIEQLRQKDKIVDATSGRKTRSVVVTDSDHLVLSSLQPQTLAERMSFGHDR